SSLLRVGKRKEAMDLIQTSLAVCDWVLGERPWDWYAKSAYTGLCCDTAETLGSLGEDDEAQKLLKRAWTVFFKQHGKEELLDRYKLFPQKGSVPAGATDADRAFFEGFGPNADKVKSGMTRFTIPCDFGGQKYPFH